MRSPSKRLILVTALLLFVCTVSLSRAVRLPERPQNYVVDLAGVIDDGIETRLNAYLAELDRRTTAQFVILTIESLEGESIEDFSITLAHDKWKLGRKGKDNGVLLVVSVKDRKYRIEVGYGLEGVLPDSLVGSIGRRDLVPFFRKGRYSEGIYRGTLAIANEIATDAGVQMTGMPRPTGITQRDGSRQPRSLFGSILSFLFFIVLVILFIRNPRLFLLLLLFSSMGGGRRGPWGGSGGGFGGGFGGGGGGGFGGGGATGSW